MITTLKLPLMRNIVFWAHLQILQSPSCVRLVANLAPIFHTSLCPYPLQGSFKTIFIKRWSLFPNPLNQLVGLPWAKSIMQVNNATVPSVVSRGSVYFRFHSDLCHHHEKKPKLLEEETLYGEEQKSPQSKTSQPPWGHITHLKLNPNELPSCTIGAK